MPGEFPVNRLFALLEVWDVIPVGDRRGRSRRRTKKKVNDRLERGGECELNCVKEGTTTCTLVAPRPDNQIIATADPCEVLLRLWTPL